MNDYGSMGSGSSGDYSSSSRMASDGGKGVLGRLVKHSGFTGTMGTVWWLIFMFIFAFAAATTGVGAANAPNGWCIMSAVSGGVSLVSWAFTLWWCYNCFVNGQRNSALLMAFLILFVGTAASAGLSWIAYGPEEKNNAAARYSLMIGNIISLVTLLFVLWRIDKCTLETCGQR